MSQTKASSYLCVGALVLLAAIPLPASEEDALDISSSIQQRHMPYGTVLDPVFAAPDSPEIVSYTRCGDSALWTGHYLAAEAFRYQATGSAEALENVRRALAGIQALEDVTGTGLLARCAIPVDSPYAPAITQEEAHNGIHTGILANTPYFWVGDTSRDQYAGVFFGLGVAYDLVDAADVRAAIRALATRLLDFLDRNDWAVVMPDGSISTVFWGRPDQQLSLLQVGRHVNPERFATEYKTRAYLTAPATAAPIALEALDTHHSYFKFNLDSINLYNLIRLESSSFLRGFYDNAYSTLRRATQDHGNAFFNLIDRGLNGPDVTRDTATRALLEQWLQRPRRDNPVDLRSVYPACGDPDRACLPIPVPQRVTTDFLWQRSPFLLVGGGAGTIEGAGIDYSLPYWMARYYGV